MRRRRLLAVEGARRCCRPATCRCSRVGSVVSFVCACACVRWLLRYISTHDFVPFAWYRIVFGVVVLATAWGGWVQWAE